MDMTALQSAIEALLFVNGEALASRRLAKVLDVPVEAVEAAAQALGARLGGDRTAGLMLIGTGGEFRLTTKPENAPSVEALVKSELQESLSRAALEVLSIVAYRAPIARVEIDAIRGVNCSFTLRNLLLRGLIERDGHPADSSRGYVYRPAFRFLETLGLRSVADLPDFETLSQDERLRTVLGETETSENTNHDS